MMGRDVRKRVVSIIGGHECSDGVERLGHELGKKLAKVAEILVSGGLSGVMEAVSSGFKSGGGQTIGIIPGYEKQAANPFIDIVIPTGLGFARNILVVKSADVVIALQGKEGTLSEIAYALQFKIPVISLNSWDIPGVINVKTVDEVIVKTKEILKRSNG